MDSISANHRVHLFLLSVCGMCVLLAAGRDAPGAERWRVTEGTTVRLASVQEGRAALTRRDAFVRRMSPLDRRLRLGSHIEVSEEQLLGYVADQVLAWGAEDTENVDRALTTIHDDLANWNLTLPDQVLLIKTTGREEAGAAYCRGAAIVLPVAKLRWAPDRLRRLLLHELFHILSSHNRPLRERLYAVVGFQPCPEITWPAAIEPRRLTNPDAPTIGHYTEVRHDGHLVKVVPVLFGGKGLDGSSGPGDGNDPAGDDRGPVPGLFEAMTFRLMVVEARGAQWSAVEERGQPVLLGVLDVPSYYEKIGRNTDYIIHPEEILAENFVLLVTGETDVPTPRVVEGMGRVLRGL